MVGIFGRSLLSLEGVRKMNKEKGENPFIENLKKNIGREITVVIYTAQGKEELTGKCEAIDFVQKSVIIRNEEATLTIPRYLYIKRARPAKGEKE